MAIHKGDYIEVVDKSQENIFGFSGIVIRNQYETNLIVENHNQLIAVVDIFIKGKPYTKVPIKSLKRIQGN